MDSWVVIVALVVLSLGLVVGLLWLGGAGVDHPVKSPRTVPSLLW